MRYHASKRIMSLSYEREPQEHADVILSHGRRYMSAARPPFSWFAVLGAIAFGLLIGLGLECYRRYALPYVLDASEIPTLSIILFQLLPFLLLISALILGRSRYLESFRKQSLASELPTHVFIDTDVYENGVETTSDHMTIWMSWSTVRDVNVAKKRIEIVSDAFVIYFPERAFSDKAAFNQAILQVSKFWRLAREQQVEKIEPRLAMTPAE
jgi:hypothetical protein